jgi:predicted component of type VI protein secretion system
LESSGSYALAVIGGFSGVQHPGTSRFHEIDRDVFDAVMQRVEPRIETDRDMCASLVFREWRDFHPDSIIERSSRLAPLLEARGVVGNESQVLHCLELAGVQLAADDAQPERSSSKSSSSAPPRQSIDADLLDSMLGDPQPDRARRTTASTDGFDAAIREIVDATRDPRDPESEARMHEAIDAALTERLRSILWHAGFRRLEESWAGLRRLVRSTPTDEDLRIAVADYPQASFAAEGGADDSALLRLLASRSGDSGGSGCIVVTDYVFDAGVDSMRQRARRGDIAERSGVTVLARAAGSATAVQDASEAALAAWSELQRRPGSRRIGLVGSRLLARGPYGTATDPIDAFPFEESPRADHPGEYSWISGSFAWAEAIAQSIVATGSPASVDRFAELENWPMHVQGAGPETGVCGPVDVLASETLREAHGLMGIVPITGIRGTDRARLLGLHSLACQPLFAQG